VGQPQQAGALDLPANYIKEQIVGTPSSFLKYQKCPYGYFL